MEQIVVENLGPGVAGTVLIQPIHYLDPAGGVVHCSFRPLFMVHPLRPETFRPEISRREPITRTSLRSREEHTVTVVDLDPSRLKDLILAAGYKHERFTQMLYFADIAGRTYRLPVAWEHPTIQMRVIGLSHPEPTAGSPERIDSLPQTLENLEIRGESFIP